VMRHPERKSFVELLSAVAPDARGDLTVLRSVFEEFMLQTPLPADVSLTATTLGGVPVLEISVPEAMAAAALLYFHGGVFALGSACSRRGSVRRGSHCPASRREGRWRWAHS
jgi:acetyl esterase/lipase